MAVVGRSSLGEVRKQSLVAVGVGVTVDERQIVTVDLAANTYNKTYRLSD